MTNNKHGNTESDTTQRHCSSRATPRRPLQSCEQPPLRLPPRLLLRLPGGPYADSRIPMPLNLRAIHVEVASRSRVRLGSGGRATSPAGLC